MFGHKKIPNSLSKNWGPVHDLVALFTFRDWKMTTKPKFIAIVAFLAVYGFGCLWLGHRNERLEWEAHVAKLEQEYERKESESLRHAERLRQEQEQRYIVQMEEVRAHNADLLADAIRVREQFDALRFGRDSTGEQCCNRVERCERLLSEGYQLAAEGEGLLRERGARLKALK